jgi:hypothetical protein
MAGRYAPMPSAESFPVDALSQQRFHARSHLSIELSSSTEKKQPLLGLVENHHLYHLFQLSRSSAVSPIEPGYLCCAVYK